MRGRHNLIVPAVVEKHGEASSQSGSKIVRRLEGRALPTTGAEEWCSYQEYAFYFQGWFGLGQEFDRRGSAERVTNNENVFTDSRQFLLEPLLPVQVVRGIFIWHGGIVQPVVWTQMRHKARDHSGIHLMSAITPALNKEYLLPHRHRPCTGLITQSILLLLLKQHLGSRRWFDQPTG